MATYGDSKTATDWITRSICVDGSDRPIAWDPYFECPAGAKRRKIGLGDPLTYHNTDQGGYQQGDSFPLLDANGKALYVHAFDFPPFNRFNLFDGSDGYDYYAVNTTWVSGAGTRDGGGYGQQFFGANCSYGDGWIFFPATGFLTGGTAQVAIAGNDWEQDGLSYPGICSRSFGYPATRWELLKNVAFGGVGDNPIKHMDAIVSYHGFEAGKQANMEVFWFTQQYGKTMWQSWHAASTKPTKTKSCAVPDTIDYQGVSYVVADCRDWSRVTMASSPAIPAWPLPPANLLQHSHFDSGGGYFGNGDTSTGTWHRGGNSAEGSIINWSLRTSAAARDSRYGPGVRYLATNCAGTCAGPAVQEIYQELPISSFIDGGTYLFGADARTEGGGGKLQITLQQIGNGMVLWQDSVQGTVSQYNGTVQSQEFKDSVYLSSALIYKITKIPIAKGAQRMRFYVTPLTSETFDILDTWLNPFPESKQ